MLVIILSLYDPLVLARRATVFGPYIRISGLEMSSQHADSERYPAMSLAGQNDGATHLEATLNPANTTP